MENHYLKQKDEERKSERGKVQGCSASQRVDEAEARADLWCWRDSVSMCWDPRGGKSQARATVILSCLPSIPVTLQLYLLILWVFLFPSAKSHQSQTFNSWNVEKTLGDPCSDPETSSHTDMNISQFSNEPLNGSLESSSCFHSFSSISVRGCTASQRGQTIGIIIFTKYFGIFKLQSCTSVPTVA